MDDHEVAFRWHDYRDGKYKSMFLNGEEFVRRYLLHVLPKGLMRIRHFGFLANRCREKKLAQIRYRLQQPPQTLRQDASADKTVPPTTGCRCPKCHKNTLRIHYEIAPKRLTGG